MVRKKTKRGLLTTDEGVYPQLKREAQTVGWTVNDISSYKNTKSSDETISKKYGKKRRILLTHDKQAHTHNLQGGFKGYIVYDQSFTETPSVQELDTYIKNCGKILSTFTSADIEKSIIIIKPMELKHEKIPLNKSS